MKWILQNKTNNATQTLNHTIWSLLQTFEHAHSLPDQRILISRHAVLLPLVPNEITKTRQQSDSCTISDVKPFTFRLTYGWRTPLSIEDHKEVYLVQSSVTVCQIVSPSACSTSANMFLPLSIAGLFLILQTVKCQINDAALQDTVLKLHNGYRRIQMASNMKKLVRCPNEREH